MAKILRKEAGDIIQNGTLTVGVPYGPTESLPFGLAGSKNTGIAVRSSFDGGEDDGTGRDTTGRINLYSYQRADVKSFGENIRRFLMRYNAKSMDAWYAARKTDGSKLPAYDASNNITSPYQMVPVAWVGAHLGSNDGLSMHGHWSIEVPDSTGAVQTRFEVPFTDQEAPEGTRILGVDVTNIRTNLADLSIRATNGQVLRVGAGNTHNKDILLSISSDRATSDRATSGRRWAIRANTDTESGANAGTNYQLMRYDDTGALLGSAIFVKRDNGNIDLGGTTASGARVTASWSSNGLHGFMAKPTTSPGNGAGFAAEMTATTDRALNIRVAGDANTRLVAFTDGKLEWGDGTNARDTNLYRSAADTLRTDDSFVAASTFRHLGGALGFYNATAITKPTVTGSRGGTAALASLLTELSNLGLITNSTTA